MGSHSACLDDKGYLYSWGCPYVSGLGTTKPVLLPTLVDTFPASLRRNPPATANRTEGGERAAAPGQEEEEEEEEDNGDDNQLRNRRLIQVAARCRDVACGAGFTVVVLKSGKVCSWGMWAQGRLGLGPTPVLTSNGRERRHRGQQNRIARYQLRPAQVRGIQNGAKVACGEAHCLLLLSSGEVMVWGANSCGQLGVGISPSGYLISSNAPILLPSFDRIKSAHNHQLKELQPLDGDEDDHDFHITSVCAGSFHSVVIDSNGSAWSWGARGTSCLGHYDALLTGPWADRINSIFSPTNGQNKV